MFKSLIIGGLVSKLGLTLLRSHGLEPARLLCPWNSPGKNTGAGCHFLLQGIFPTQGSNLGLLHCRRVCNHLHCNGSTPIIRAMQTQTMRYLLTPIKMAIITISTSNWRRQWHHNPIFLPGKSHGRRSLVGSSPWGR